MAASQTPRMGKPPVRDSKANVHSSRAKLPLTPPSLTPPSPSPSPNGLKIPTSV